MTLPCPGGQGGAACVRIRRCLPCGQRRCKVARRIWACRGKKRFLKALCPSGGFAGAPGTAKTFVPLSMEGTAALSSAYERRMVHRPASSAAAFSPCRPAGRTAGSARTRPRDQSLGNPFLGTGLVFPRLSVPQNAAGGRPLLVSLPPSTRTTAPYGTKRSTHAPCSWGMGAYSTRQRHWLPALPAHCRLKDGKVVNADFFAV